MKELIIASVLLLSVIFSNGCTILQQNHKKCDLKPISIKIEHLNKEVNITNKKLTILKNNVVDGANALILGDVVLGNNCIIGGEGNYFKRCSRQYNSSWNLEMIY